MNTLKFGNGEWYGKKDTILAYNDENSNFKPLPFSFDRASSATVINKDGLIETVGSGEPRIDFSNDAKGALLLEPTRSNLVTYSEAFDNAAWIKVGGAITPNIGVSPDGSLNADRFYISTAAANTRLYINYTYSASTYTASVYAKNNGNTNTFRFSYADSGGQSFSPNFTLTNQWQRFEYTFTSVGGSGVFWFACVTSSTGVGSELDIQIFGAQLEQGSYATSYIPTQGSAVTRVADVCNNGGNEQVINSTEGTLYVEANLIDGYDNNNWLGIIYDSSNANNRIYIQRYLGNIQSGIRVNGVIQSEITQSSSSLGKNKIAFTYKLNEFKMFVNGSQVGVTDTIGSVFSADTLDKLNVGVYHNDTLNFNNVINDFRLYNTALTDAELQALTSN